MGLWIVLFVHELIHALLARITIDTHDRSVGIDVIPSFISADKKTYSGSRVIVQQLPHRLENSPQLCILLRQHLHLQLQPFGIKLAHTLVE
jgi:hypothetical protein